MWPGSFLLNAVHSDEGQERDKRKRWSEMKRIIRGEIWQRVWSKRKLYLRHRHWERERERGVHGEEGKRRFRGAPSGASQVGGGAWRARGPRRIPGRDPFPRDLPLGEKRAPGAPTPNPGGPTGKQLLRSAGRRVSFGPSEKAT